MTTTKSMRSATSGSPAAPAIGVFDSGVGGLSIFEAVRRRLPGARYAYCSDNGNFPYGTKSEDEVVRVTQAGAERFIAKAGLDLLIIACNTASTVALPHLRSKFAVPVVGVVPAIKPAAAMTRTRTIALLATPGTVARAYTDELIQSFAPSCRVIRLGSRLLMGMAERKLRGEPVSVGEIRADIQPMFDQSPSEEFKRLDTVVLGCTHFPLLLAELEAAAPWPVQWIDSSEAIAARTEYLMTNLGIDVRTVRDVPPPIAYFTQFDAGAEALRPALEGRGFAGLDEV